MKARYHGREKKCTGDREHPTGCEEEEWEGVRRPGAAAGEYRRVVFTLPSIVYGVRTARA